MWLVEWVEVIIMKKGQVSHVFTYIMAIIIFAVILIFGYRAISEFVDKGERVAFVTFKTDLEGAVGEIASDYGSVVVYNAQHPLKMPGKYEKICFIDVDKPPVANCNGLLNPIICDAWKTAFDAGGFNAAEANVFLEPIGILPIKVYRIKVDTNGNRIEDGNDAGYICFDNVGGRVNLRLEGKGDHTFISRP